MVSYVVGQRGGGDEQREGAVSTTTPTLADSLLCVNLSSVFHGVDGEVDLGHRLLLADGTNGIVHLHVALLLLHVGGRLAVFLHPEAS